MEGGRVVGNTSRLPLISLECVEHTLPACECPSVCASARVCVCVCVLVVRPVSCVPVRGTGRAGLMQPLGDTNKSKHDKTIENFFHFHF